MKSIIIISVLGLLIATPAYAYIDPGSGSAILTILIGMIVAFGLGIKSFYYKALRFLGFKKKPKKTLEKDANDEDR